MAQPVPGNRFALSSRPGLEDDPADQGPLATGSLNLDHIPKFCSSSFARRARNPRQSAGLNPISIEAMLLDVLIDPHPSIKDEQHEDGVVPKRVVDVVALLENQTADTARLVVDAPEQGISAQALQDKAIYLVLKRLGVVLRVV